jgi:hypothetical protein
MELYRSGVPLPGQEIQRAVAKSGLVATGTTAYTGGNTAPTSTQGNQYLAQAITPTSLANLLEIEAQATLSSSASGGTVIAALQQDSVSAALTSAYDAAGTNDTVPSSQLLGGNLNSFITIREIMG